MFLHAGIADSSMWQAQVRHYVKRFTVVRFDMRGYGESQPVASPFIPVEDCRAVLDALGIHTATLLAPLSGALSRSTSSLRTRRA